MKRAGILVALMMGLTLLTHCDYPSSKELSREKKLELAEKCSKDGKAYFDDFVRNMGISGYAWDTPEYHYSTNMNTCLIHIRYFELDTTLSLQCNQVVDIFSNKTILYGWFWRNVENGTETLTEPPQQGVPNYTSIAYFKERDKLFRE